MSLQVIFPLIGCFIIFSFIHSVAVSAGNCNQPYLGILIVTCTKYKRLDYDHGQSFYLLVLPVWPVALDNSLDYSNVSSHK